jgi:hypothetical protein
MNRQLPLSVKDLVVGLGGNRVVAGRIGVRSQAVSNWIAANVVPAEHHVTVWRMALEAGLAWEPPGADSIRHLLGAPAPAATQAA